MFLFYSLARYAFLDVLTALKIGSNSSVLMPSFICRDMLAPINQVGAKIVWYDVDEQLNPVLAPSKWPKADVVLAVNYFGFPQELNVFKSYTNLHNAVLVEDNAHGYLSMMQNGEKMGCRADFGLFSMRKTIRMPDGAALWVSRKTGLMYPTLQLMPELKGFQPREKLKSQIREIPLIGEESYLYLIKLTRVLRKLLHGAAYPRNDWKSEVRIPHVSNPWSGLFKSIDKVNAATEIKRRRVTYLDCESSCQSIGAIPIFSSLPENCAPYAFPFRATKSQFQRMKKVFGKKGFDVVSWPDLPCQLVNSIPSHYLNTYMVNFLW